VTTHRPSAPTDPETPESLETLDTPHPYGRPPAAAPPWADLPVVPFEIPVALHAASPATPAVRPAPAHGRTVTGRRTGWGVR
jgi:hypothetical protein